METTKKIAAIYCRISGEDQSHFSLQTQQDACQSLAQAQGYTVPESHILIDNGISGSTLQRPALRQLRDLVQASAIQGVICLDPDRLSRSLGHLLLLEEEGRKHGVTIHYVYFPNPDSPEGKLMLSVRGAVAEYERAKILQRSWNGKVKRAEAGLPMVYGCVPYGYQLVDGRLEIEPTEAEVMKRMFAWRLEGLGVMKIVRLLTAEGVPTRADLGGGISKKTRERGVWAPSTVHRMLRNTAYIGRMAWNKRNFIEPADDKRRKSRNDKRPQSASQANPTDEWIEIPCPSIIEPHVFAAVQALMDQGKTTSPRRRTREYLFLGGRLRCGKCESAMSGFYYGKKQARFYRCTGSRHNVAIRCSNTLRAEPFEEHTWDAIQGLLEHPEYLRQELTRRQGDITREHGVTARDVELIDSKIRGLRERLQRFQAAYGEGVLTLEDFKTIKVEHDAELASLERLRAELQGNLDQTSRKQTEISAAVAFIERVRDELPTYTLAEKRQVVELLDIRCAYTSATVWRLYFHFPAERGLDPRDFYAGDAFAAKRGYLADSFDSLSKPGRG